LGLQLRAIKLGNEPYWDGRSFNKVQPYIDDCKRLAEAIRQHHPEIKIGACFGPLEKGFSHETQWNEVLAKEPWFDAIVHHDYYGGQRFALEEGQSLPVEALLRPEAFIEMPVDYYAKFLPGMPIWLTEWNIGNEGLKQWKNTGAKLHFLAAMMTCLITHRDSVEWA
jgi:hypothetical protein